jgi:hypothetical protein
MRVGASGGVDLGDVLRVLRELDDQPVGRGHIDRAARPRDLIGRARRAESVSAFRRREVSSLERSLARWHWRLMASLFHERDVSKVVERQEPSLDVDNHSECPYPRTQLPSNQHYRRRKVHLFGGSAPISVSERVLENHHDDAS